MNDHWQQFQADYKEWSRKQERRKWVEQHSNEIIVGVVAIILSLWIILFPMASRIVINLMG